MNENPAGLGPAGFDLTLLGLNARNVLGARAFFALRDLKADFVANLKLVKRHAVQILGMEEKVLRLAIASDETESPRH